MAKGARPKFRIRKGDRVVVVAGDDKGKVGTVVRVIPREARVVVEGVNIVKRHVKGTVESAGRIVEKEAPVHISNVALWDEKEKRKVKVGYRFEDGRKLRVDRKTGRVID